jgi:hypothetical protein
MRAECQARLTYAECSRERLKAMNDTLTSHFNHYNHSKSAQF